MTLTPEGYIPRIADKQLEDMLSVFGAVCIEGPKWCGKSWTALNKAESAIFLDDPANNFSKRKLAQIEPSSVLVGESPRLIDEWQEAPLLWDAVRHEVDKKRESGRFILTGSSTPERKGIQHSGIGRFGIMKMRPMSLFESSDSNGAVSLQSIFSETVKPVEAQPVNLKRLTELIARGGWPSNIKRTGDLAQKIPRGYLDLLTREEVPRLNDYRYNTEKMEMVIRSLARNEGTAASISSISKDVSEFGSGTADSDTVSSYLDVLNRLFIIETQPAFSINFRSSLRVGKTPKRHFIDPSLAAAALGLTSQKMMSDLDTLGFLFQSLCKRDLRVYAESFGGNLFHYRDHSGREIDSVIEMPDGTWGAFEIKLGSDRLDEAAEKLIEVKNMIVDKGLRNPPKILCIICGVCDYAYTREDGVMVIPITALKN